MKLRWSTLVIFLLTATFVQAQTEKGRWTVGTQIGNFSYQNQYGSKSFSGSLTPSAGYFVANGFVVGAGVPFSISTYRYPDLNFNNLRYVSTGIGVAPFIRYYIGAGKVKPFAGVAYSYSGTTGTYKVDTNGGAQTKTKGHSTAFTPTLGAAYFINRSLAITASLNYNVSHQEFKTVETSPYSPGASSGNTDNRNLSLNFGFQLFIGK